MDASNTNSSRPEQVSRTETILSNIWRELLPATVSRDDDFIRLGGTSLIAVQLIARIVDEFGAELAVREIFSSPTIAKLSLLVEGYCADSSNRAVSDDAEVARLRSCISALPDSDVSAMLRQLKGQE